MITGKLDGFSAKSPAEIPSPFSLTRDPEVAALDAAAPVLPLQSKHIRVSAVAASTSSPKIARRSFPPPRPCALSAAAFGRRR